MADSSLNRRRLLVLGGTALGAAAVAACTPGNAAGGGQTTTSAAPTTTTTSAAETTTTTASSSVANTCVLTSEVTQGPYWLDDSLVRSDITEGKAGAALTLRLTVVDYTDGCAPLADAAVEIWHCDAWGYYSGYTTASPGGSAPPEDGTGDENTYLRGILITDDSGIVEFTTIFPGWYSPRAVHIHCKVYTGGAIDSGTNTYEGGTAHHTGQFFFPDELVAQVEAVEPYSQHTGTITTLDNDMIYTGNGVQDGLLSTSGSIGEGFVGTITVGVDPNYTAPEGGDGGTPPSGEPPTGTPPTDLPTTTSETPATTSSSATTTTTTN